MSTVTCKSTRYGPGCGHPVDDHAGLPANPCCCCNWQQNVPSHGARCQRCRPIIYAYLVRVWGGEDKLPADIRAEFGHVAPPPERRPS